MYRHSIHVCLYAHLYMYMYMYCIYMYMYMYMIVLYWCYRSLSSAKHTDEIVSTDHDNEKRQILRDVEVCRERDRQTYRMTNKYSNNSIFIIGFSQWFTN